MASTILRNIITVFSSGVLLISSGFRAQACMEVELPEAYRISMFRAEVEGMSSFSQFYYSASLLPDYFANPSSKDRKQNCLEWKKELNNKPLMSDIYAILYKVNPDMFVYAYNEKSLDDIFEGNTFVTELLLPENKNFLIYLVLAKAAEYHENYESDLWRTIDYLDSKRFKNNLISWFYSRYKDENSEFLKQRYAYQLARLFCETGNYEKCISLYDDNFKGSQDSTIIEPWTLLYKALALDETGDKIEANYFYAQVFSRCDEKKLRSYQCFNTTLYCYSNSLLLAKTNAEKIPIIALFCFHNPGPALDKLKEIFALDPDSRYLAPLIMREVNKLEDWIVTPSLTSGTPSVSLDSTYDSYNYRSKAKWEKAKQKNLLRDKQYLVSVIDFLTTMYATSKGEMHDYLAVCIAHLWLLDDNLLKSSAYLDAVSKDASKSILFQKYVDGLLINIGSGDLNSNAVKESLGTQLIYLQKEAKTSTTLFKTLYSIVLKLSIKYEKLGNYAMAGLLKNKSEALEYEYFSNSDFAFLYNNENVQPYYNYSAISYFDDYAKPSDIDTVLRIITKPETSLDTFACTQKLTCLNAYKDLKGTLAFRMDSLQLAYKTFSGIPDTFYLKESDFKKELNEDTYLPKIWPQTRNFKYKFSKAKFVKQLIDLEKEAATNRAKAGADYLKLANAYFNCTYWGNSWMMFSYYQSFYYYQNDSWQSYLTEGKNLRKKYNSIYFECSKAITYYYKALYSTKNYEITAKALFMLYACNYSASCYRSSGYAWDEKTDKKNKITSPFLKLLCLNYRNTRTFEDISSNCSTVKDYAETLGLR